MPRHERPNPETDPFRPPAIPTEVCCMHCGQEYESYLIEWHERIDERGAVHGFWCCPTPGCDGMGFGFDIFPTDPEYRGEDGEPMWVDDGFDDEFDDEFDDDPMIDDELMDPDPPASGSLPPPVDLDLDDVDSPKPHRRRFPDDDEDIPF